MRKNALPKNSQRETSNISGQKQLNKKLEKMAHALVLAETKWHTSTVHNYQEKVKTYCIKFTKSKYKIKLIKINRTKDMYFDIEKFKKMAAKTAAKI